MINKITFNEAIFYLQNMDETQHYLIEPLISYINEVDEDLEEELVTENDELVNDDDNIYSDPSELHINDLFQD
ncbi:hypothetical protein RclHR1_00170030 [Rhizophagus clarus]|uniref:Uncharacterized protein n=1 Tax=Rhizophagus clarus TaxID=94130 RepID=A0A2Z6RBP2_9GLOM|nr:hypothetical protein RclHR1_00170030 [Rhizophagus clarus]